MSQKIQALVEKNIISEKSRVVFVDDGSKDNTWNIIESLNKKNIIFWGIKLTKNRGHQNALLAGLITFRTEADAFISLDADLQDDINAIDEMVMRFNEGFDIVYGVRRSRSSDSFFKRNTALLFYKFMRLMGVNIVHNHADYRLMSKRTVLDFEKYKEVNLFIRGIIPLIGYKSCIVKYERHKRFAGESKYPLKKMILFALDGITSFSIHPIRLIMIIGVIIFSVSLGMLIFTLVSYFQQKMVPGLPSMLMSIWALGGLQLLAIGIVGEYVAKSYMETKGRPRFSVEEILTSSV